jgi:hypothetical protein
VKKLANFRHGRFYRAKLDYANRLLFTLVRHGGVAYALMREVIEQHAYDKSRFLRGAPVDEVQDLTNAQLALVLAMLAKPGRFLLCGDSNQIGLTRTGCRRFLRLTPELLLPGFGCAGVIAEVQTHPIPRAHARAATA